MNTFAETKDTTIAEQGETCPVRKEHFVIEQWMKLLNGDPKLGNSDMMFSEQAAKAVVAGLQEAFPDKELPVDYYKKLKPEIEVSLNNEGLHINLEKAVSLASEEYQINKEAVMEGAASGLQKHLEQSLEFVAQITGMTTEDLPLSFTLEHGSLNVSADQQKMQARQEDQGQQETQEPVSAQHENATPTASVIEIAPANQRVTEPDQSRYAGASY